MPILVALSFLASPEESWAPGRFHVGTIPVIRAKIEGKEVDLALHPSLERTRLAPDVAKEGEARMEIAGHEIIVRPDIGPIPEDREDPFSGRKVSGWLGRDALLRYSFGFYPDTLRWRVWKGQVGDTEARTFIGAEPEPVTLYLLRNLVWVSVRYGGTRKDAVLAMNTDNDSLPGSMAGAAGFLYHTTPFERWYRFDSGLSGDEGLGLFVIREPGRLAAQLPFFSVNSFGRAPFLLDLSGKRLWRERPVGGRLLEQRLWAILPLRVDISGERMTLREGGFNALTYFKPYQGLELLSLGGIPAKEIVRTLRERDEAGVKRLGEVVSKSYSMVFQGKDGQPVELKTKIGAEPPVEGSNTSFHGLGLG